MARQKMDRRLAVVQRIHIVGYGPRTGTTLMMEAMIACFEIDLYVEHEAKIWTWPSRRADIFLTKHTQDILVVGSILPIMGNLHVIYMLRDPRDMIVSKHAIEPNKYWAGLRFWKFRTQYARRIQAHPRFITIRYEDLVTKPDYVQAYLMHRMPFLKKRALFSRYHEISKASDKSVRAMGALRPITPVSVGSWRRHKARVAGQIQLHGSITQDLIAYGYEQDAAWVRELDGIEPDLSASFWPEYQQEQALRNVTRHKSIKGVWLLLGHYGPVVAIWQHLAPLKRRVMLVRTKLAPLYHWLVRLAPRRRDND